MVETALCTKLYPCASESFTIENKFCSQKPSIITSLVDVTQILERRGKLPCRVFFKNESEQPSGSFKLRGIGNLIQKSILKAIRPASSSIHVFASSGGNAGLAAAYASRFYRVKCTVVVPLTTMPHVVDKLKQLGSQVILQGSSIGEADKYARQLSAQCSQGVHVIYCHPFDHHLIWEGHAEIVNEIFTQLQSTDFHHVKGVVCSVGGGGLYNGIMSGLKANGSTADCVLVETQQAPTLTKAVEAGSVVNLSTVETVATSLGCSYVSEETLKLFKDQTVNKSHLIAIDDSDAIDATVSYYNDLGKIVEPACGAALSVVYSQLGFLTKSIPALTKDDIVVVIVCGGSCTNKEILSGYIKKAREQHI